MTNTEQADGPDAAAAGAEADLSIRDLGPALIEALELIQAADAANHARFVTIHPGRRANISVKKGE